jgi:hypothetical protein
LVIFVMTNTTTEAIPLNTGFSQFSGNAVEIDMNLVDAPGTIAPTGTAAAILISTVVQDKPTGGLEGIVIVGNVLHCNTGGCSLTAKATASVGFDCAICINANPNLQAIRLGAANFDNNEPSQGIEFQAVNSGGRLINTQIYGDQAGNLDIMPASIAGVPATTGNSGLALNKPSSGGGSVLIGETAGLTRWEVLAGNATTEAGSNTGSDLQICRANDAGAIIDCPMTITRSSGVVTLGNVSGISLAGPTTVRGMETASGHISNGATFTIASGCGTPTALKGGATTGSFAAGQTACAPVITLPTVRTAGGARPLTSRRRLTRSIYG